MVSDPTWLASTIEDAVEPDLPIIDPHHHLWGFPRTRYFLEELLADTADHNVRQTVFVECGAMYRADGPESMKPLGGNRVRSRHRGAERERPLRRHASSDRHCPVTPICA